MGRAKLLSERFRNEIRYSETTDFLCYNGVYWKTGASPAHCVMHRLSDLQLQEAEPELAELMGCRMALASEFRENVSLSTGVIKQLASTDPTHAEKKYGAPFDFVPTHTLVVYTNHLPRVPARDEGIWRRLVVVPFNAAIRGNSDVKNYGDYLFEHAGGAVLKWIMEGAVRVMGNGFRVEKPACVLEAMRAFREENDWFAHFTAECCVADPTAVSRSGDFYNAYRAWAVRNGESVRSSSDFYGAIDKAGYRRGRDRNFRFIEGIRLKTVREEMTEEEAVNGQTLDFQGS